MSTRIPPGAQLPTNPNPSSAYSVQVTPPEYRDSFINPWDFDIPPPPPPHDTPRPRVRSMFSGSSSRTRHRTPISFPEPQIYRAASETASSALRPQSSQSHRHSRSDLGPNLTLRSPSLTSVVSTSSSYNLHEAVAASETESLTETLSNLNLESDEGLRKFQAGELPDSDQEWHKLVPAEAREALGDKEVQRQSVIFEIIKGEREYVADLEAVQDLYVNNLRSASPHVIPLQNLDGFISEVFSNLNQILAHHQRMLGALFERQRDQHPLIQSVADILLDTILKSDFRPSYETYIKHYPLSESHHRKELKRNRAYEVFIQSLSNDPRIRKRDLITFLSRPVTRLPRLNLLLEQTLKLTNKEYEHPDLETLPIIVGILGDCIKSTQPGIEAAEGKVKFWALCESLVFQKGEIIDMDLYDESRTLVYSSPVVRRTKTDTSFTSGWTDLVAALLDNYFILAREEKRSNGSIRRILMSRPLPLSFLRLGSFSQPPETRRERTNDEGGGILDSLRYQHVPLYPFTIYHASQEGRRYTLYVGSEAGRERWKRALVDAGGVDRVRNDSNMWFEPKTLSDGYFRAVGRKMDQVSATRVSGKITSAAPFWSGGRKFIAVGCYTGIYAAPWGTEKFHKILPYRNPRSLYAIQTLKRKTFNRLLVHVDTAWLSYSLDAVGRLALGKAQEQTVEATLERIGGNDANIVFAKPIRVGDRVLVIYASKRRLGSTLTLHVHEAMDVSELGLTPRRTVASATHSFRPFGEPGYIPKDAYDITALVKTIGICTEDGIVIADPTSLANSTVTLVPDLGEAGSNLPMANLKLRIDASRPLGLVRVDGSELLVIYDQIGCYITKHGKPTRSCGFLKWETKAVSYAHRGTNLLLFSPEFIEVRNVTTGRLVQVVEGKDVRLLSPGMSGVRGDGEGNSEGNGDGGFPIVVVMRGMKDDGEGVSDQLVELVETSAIVPPTPVSALPEIWDEWGI